MASTLSRRRFLARTGVVGAAALAAFEAGTRPARAQVGDALGPVFANLTPGQQELARDTVAGICAMVIPGPDEYSVAQGVTDDRPGAIAAGNVDFMLQSLDNFLPIEGASTPVSFMIAMFFNNVALQVNPAAAAPTPFSAPFANLSWDEKIEVIRTMEEETASTLAALDEELDEPMKSSLSGLVEFVPGAVIEFVAFGTMSEWQMFDPDNPTVLAGRPIGWDLSGYMQDRLTPVHGWDDFLGFYGDLEAVDGSWDKGEGVLAP